MTALIVRLENTALIRLSRTALWQASHAAQDSVSQQDVEQDNFRALLGRLAVSSALKGSIALILEWGVSLMTTDVQPGTTVRQGHRANGKKNVRLGTTARQEHLVSRNVLRALTIQIQQDRL